jgi:hypothetical protein
MIDVYLEVGKKKTIAGALEWPGWSRGGKDEDSALRVLCDYGVRYADVLNAAGLEFQAPSEMSAFNVVERLDGDATTDYGTPGLAPAYDAKPLNEDQLERLLAILNACWGKFDQAVQAASGKDLRKGPRGGGRDLDKIFHHVLDADIAYLRKVGFKLDQPEGAGPQDVLQRYRQAVPQALAASRRGELPSQGPRGGRIWTARYFVRRSAWHVLDHAWEIEDRIL